MFGNYELTARDEPFNKKENGRSFKDREGFKIKEVDGKNVLTGSDNEYFTIVELECYQL